MAARLQPPAPDSASRAHRPWARQFSPLPLATLACDGRPGARLQVREGPPSQDEGAGGRGGPECLDTLVRSARRGDPLAFRGVAEHLAPALLRYVMRFTGQGRDFANDVVQDTLVAAWCNLDSIRDDGHIRPWAYRVARFKAVDRLRRRGPRGLAMASLDVGIEMEVEPAAPRRSDPADETNGRGAAVRDALDRALRRLPAHYAGAVRLHYLHGMPIGETARLLGLPTPTIKMRLLRARARLRRLLRVELKRHAVELRNPARVRPRVRGPRAAGRTDPRTRREGDTNGPTET